MEICGSCFSINVPCNILGAEYMQIGNGFSADKGLRLECISYYEGVHYHPQLIIGDGVSCKLWCHIGCLNKITIGNNVS